MQDEIGIFPIIDSDGRLFDITRECFADILRVHRQLRPSLPDKVPDYRQKLRRMAREGARVLVARLHEQIAGVALYRMYENTYEGLRLYIDDLIVDENCRSQGVGHALLQSCRNIAEYDGCDYLVLDSGTQRTQAHKLYFREGFAITAFNFTQRL